MLRRIVCVVTDEAMRLDEGPRCIPGQWREVCGHGEMCSASKPHYYSTPALAAMMNPGHGKIQNPRLWEAELEGDMRMDYRFRIACRLRLLRELEMPQIGAEQRVRFGVEAAARIVSRGFLGWHSWAKDWLSDSDRRVKTAWAMARDVESVRRIFDRAAENAASSAAYAAGWLAEGRVDLAAEAAADAAVAAREGNAEMNLVEIAEMALLRPAGPSYAG